MKKILMTLAVCVLTSSAVMAQESKNEDKRPERKMDKTEMVKRRTDAQVKKYGLSDKQAQSLLALNTKYADKMGPGMGPRHHGGPGLKGPRGPRGDWKGKTPNESKEPNAPKRPKMDTERKAHEETMKAYDAELQKIMSEEQYKQYQADMKNRKGPRGPRKPREPQDKD